MQPQVHVDRATREPSDGAGIEFLGSTPEHPDLRTELPASAPDYYALHEGTPLRRSYDLYALKGGLLTVDYTRRYRYHFCIQDSSGRPILPQQQRFLIDARTDVVDVEGRVAFADDWFTKFNICHFLFDKLWRAECFRAHAPDSYVFLSNNEYTDSALSMLGMRATELPVRTGEIVTYRFEELLVSSSSMNFRHPGNNFAPEIVDVLGRLHRATDDNGSSPSRARRVFVDRRKAPTRRILNMADIVPVLAKHGIEMIAPEELSLTEQIRAFGDASVVVGVHGAGLSNAWFCRSERAQLLEILPPLCATSGFWKLAMAKGLRYDAFVAADPELERPDYATWQHRPAEFNRRDVIVDAAALDAFLARNLGGAD